MSVRASKQQSREELVNPSSRCLGFGQDVAELLWVELAQGLAQVQWFSLLEKLLCENFIKPYRKPPQVCW